MAYMSTLHGPMPLIFSKMARASTQGVSSKRSKQTASAPANWAIAKTLRLLAPLRPARRSTSGPAAKTCWGVTCPSQCRFDTRHHSCGSFDTQLLPPHDAHKGFEGGTWKGQVQRRMPRNDCVHLWVLLLHKGTKLFIHSFHHPRKLNIFAP